VDTAPFRQSVWYYVHRIFGVLHDDYDYSQVNTFMNRHMKAWVKNMVCKPFQVTLADTNLGYHLQPQEKCHIALLGTLIVVVAAGLITTHLMRPSVLQQSRLESRQSCYTGCTLL